MLLNLNGLRLHQGLRTPASSWPHASLENVSRSRSVLIMCSPFRSVVDVDQNMGKQVTRIYIIASLWICLLSPDSHLTPSYLSSQTGLLNEGLTSHFWSDSSPKTGEGKSMVRHDSNEVNHPETTAPSSVSIRMFNPTWIDMERGQFWQMLQVRR